MDTDIAYAAGFISAMGSITVNDSWRKSKYGEGVYVRLMVKTSNRPDGLKRVAQALGTETRETTRGLSLTLTGEPLHEAMTKLWPYLSAERKREYVAARRSLTSNQTE